MSRDPPEPHPRRAYPLRCPVCGTAMIGERAEPESEDFARHRCLNCGTVIETLGGSAREDE